MALLTPIPDPPDQTKLPWYAKDHSLPVYRFVPGLNPHPLRDPKGHSYRTVRSGAYPDWTPDRWEKLEPYLKGVDLFNRFYFWEAHEAWEPLWTSYPPEAEPAQFIQGLINVTASFLKLHMQENAATERLWSAASIQLGPFIGKEWMGIDVNQFLKEAETYLLPVKRGACPILGPDTPIIRLRSLRKETNMNKVNLKRKSKTD